MITRIERKSALSKRYLIYFNGEPLLSIHEDVLVKQGLYKGMEVEAAKIRELLRAEEFNQVRMAALRYLSYRPRTTQELRQYLTKKDFSAGYIDQIVEEMKEQGYLNDQQYAKDWVEERRNRKSYGINRIKNELRQKGIASQWIDEAISHVEENEERQLALEVAKRRYLRICHEPWSKIERKIGQFLLYRGFPMGIVYEILQELKWQHQREGEK